MRYSWYMQLHQPIQSSLTLSTHRQPSFWSIWLALWMEWMVQWPVEICLVATQTADFWPFLVFVIGRHMMFAAYKRFIMAKWKVFRLRFLSNNESRRKLCKKHNKVKKKTDNTPSDCIDRKISSESWQPSKDTFLLYSLFLRWACTWIGKGISFLGVPCNYGNRIMAKRYRSLRNGKVAGINWSMRINLLLL